MPVISTGILLAIVISSILFLMILGFVVYRIYDCCNKKQFEFEHDKIDDPSPDDDGKIGNDDYDIAKFK